MIVAGCHRDGTIALPWEGRKDGYMGGSWGGWNVQHQDLYANMRENTILQENIREREKQGYNYDRQLGVGWCHRRRL